MGDYLISWPFRVSTTLRRGEKEGSFIFDIEFKSEALNATSLIDAP